MKYHHQKGVVEKDKRGHKKLWLAFFGLIGIVVYGGFIFGSLALNGWPLEPVDTTAKLVKTTKPGDLGNYLFVPAINLRVDVKQNLVQSGKPRDEKVSLKGNHLGFGVTPDGLRQASPFFNLDKLQTGDEVFLDSDGVRYAYKIVDKTDNHQTLILQSPNQRVIAEAVGTVAWENGSARLELF